jgi:hypothetical protein
VSAAYLRRRDAGHATTCATQRGGLMGGGGRCLRVRMMCVCVCVCVAGAGVKGPDDDVCVWRGQVLKGLRAADKTFGHTINGCVGRVDAWMGVDGWMRRSSRRVRGCVDAWMRGCVDVWM